MGVAVASAFSPPMEPEPESTPPPTPAWLRACRNAGSIPPPTVRTGPPGKQWRTDGILPPPPAGHKGIYKRVPPPPPADSPPSSKGKVPPPPPPVDRRRLLKFSGWGGRRLIDRFMRESIRCQES